MSVSASRAPNPVATREPSRKTPIVRAVPPLGAWARLRAFLGRLQEWGLPRGHRRRIRQSRRVLRTLRPGLADPQGAPRVFGYLRKIDPLTFEELVLESFRRMGYPIRRNRRYTGDGGVDGRVKIARRWMPIQCKRYTQSLSPAHVEDFGALVSQIGWRSRGQGFFIHTGRTGPLSRQTVRIAQGQIVMVSGDRLITLLRGDRSAVGEWVLSARDRLRGSRRS